MATIADLVIKVTADTDSVTRDLQSVGAKTGAILKKSFLPAVGVLGGLAVGAKKAGDAASNLAESQNAVGVVFGKSAAQITAFGKTAARTAGLSMRALNEAVVPLGASFTNLGDSQDVAAQKSVTLAKRAADMASVFNTDVGTALQAIQAGLRGEADPLEQFGVGLSDAAVSAKAMSMGLASTKAELTAGDKAQARYALLLDQTNKFQGDFAKTSTGAANAARINAAAQENVTASIGKGVLPAMQMYQSILGTVTGFMARHTTAVKVGAVALAALAVAVIAANVATTLYAARVPVATAATKLASAATKAWTAAQWLLNAALSANPIGIVIIAIAALAAAFVIAYRRSETFRNIVTSAMNAARSAVSSAMGAIRSAVGAVVGVFNAAVSAVYRLISAIRSIPAPHIPGAGLLGKLPGFAHGVSNFGGGLALVGEQGPELVGLPRGSSVFSNRDSREMLSGSGDGAPVINVYPSVRDETDIELIARRVARVMAFQS